VAQNRAGELGEEALDEVEPGAVLGLLVAALVIVAFASFFSTGIDPHALASMANDYP
jgi:hypothetical protein